MNKLEGHITWTETSDATTGLRGVLTFPDIYTEAQALIEVGQPSEGRRLQKASETHNNQDSHITIVYMILND